MKPFLAALRRLLTGPPSRMRKMLVALPILTGDVTVAKSGPGFDGGPGYEPFSSDAGRTYTAPEMERHLQAFLIYVPWCNKARGIKAPKRQYCIGLVPLKTDLLHFVVDSRWDNPVNVSFLTTERLTAQLADRGKEGIKAERLQIEGHYRCPSAARGGDDTISSMGEMTIIRTGENSFKGTYSLYSSIYDLVEWQRVAPKA